MNIDKSLENVGKNFDHIKKIYANVGIIFQEINQKLSSLNTIYTELVKTHSIKEYTFGLDAFHFQNKLIEHEYAHLQHLLHTIRNRFYCEYYKLYKIIREYAENEIKININFINKHSFPVYKDLDKNITYDFSLTVDIQSIILKYIHALNDYSLTKQKELNNNTQRSKSGINIEHIVHYQSFTFALLEEQIVMYIRYMETLNKHHTKYITRLYTIVKDFIDDINEDIVSEEDSVNDDDNDDDDYRSYTESTATTNLNNAIEPSAAAKNLNNAIEPSATETTSLNNAIEPSAIAAEEPSAIAAEEPSAIAAEEPSAAAAAEEPSAAIAAEEPSAAIAVEEPSAAL